MTREEAKEQAERKVYCFMTKGSIDDEMAELKLKCKKSRSDKEQALIAYYTEKWTTKEEADASVAKSEQEFQQVINSL